MSDCTSPKTYYGLSEGNHNFSLRALDSVGNKLFCICHSSRFDHTVIEKNTNINKDTGASFEYYGIKRTGGPAPVGIPLVPYVVNNDIMEAIDFEAEGVVEILDWYTYCN